MYVSRMAQTDIMIQKKMMVTASRPIQSPWVLSMEKKTKRGNT